MLTLCSILLFLQVSNYELLQVIKRAGVFLVVTLVRFTFGKFVGKLVALFFFFFFIFVCLLVVPKAYFLCTMRQKEPCCSSVGFNCS